MKNDNDNKKEERLGDHVHAILHPIAEKIDAVAGTDLAHCSACARRRAFLNKMDEKIRGKVSVSSSQAE
ncbi:MAG: hypothetical protein LBV12_00540 [Puniceicoccales bacterium]|jgi:hypothetical protein|nr:hypothetical protein [Puniceicoccales bacterium]